MHISIHMVDRKVEDFLPRYDAIVLCSSCSLALVLCFNSVRSSWPALPIFTSLQLVLAQCMDDSKQSTV